VPSGTRHSPGNLSKSLAAIIDETRKMRGMTATELGARCGISQSQMSKYLRATRVLNVEQLKSICAALNVDMARMLREANR
jgi:transcriptional regulator with XRE-family HTH domain